MRSLAFLLGPLVLAASTLGFAPAPIYKGNGRAPGSVLKRLQGTWTVSRYEISGQNLLPAGEDYIVRIEKGQWTFSRKGATPPKTNTYTLKLDPKAKPAAVDFVRDKTCLALGAYALEGDTWKIVFRAADGTKKERARDLATPGPGDYYLQLERKR